MPSFVLPLEIVIFVFQVTKPFIFSILMLSKDGKCKIKLTPWSNMPLMMDSSISEFSSIADTNGCIFSVANLATEKWENTAKTLCLSTSETKVLACIGGTGMAQQWEHSSPTNVAQGWLPLSASSVGWDGCWFLSVPQEVFLWVLWFSALLNNQYCQIPIWSEWGLPLLSLC